MSSNTHLSTFSEGKQPLDTSVVEITKEVLVERSHMKDVVNFHAHFELDKECQPKPAFLPAHLAEVRANFLQEELNEYCLSCGLTRDSDGRWVDTDSPRSEEDLESALDGLVDLQYVLLGTAHLHGFEPIWNTAWTRVQDANMLKVRVENADDSKRGTTHDVRKPEGWEPPQFRDLLFY
jgi:predicted HAD superfamily Cof-like phosphohydrolase